MARISHLKILELKSVMLKKVLKELLQLLNSVDQEVSVALLTSEFDKLGLRVGEKHLLAVLKADPNIGKNQCS
jgi:hypothetical protein